MQASSHNGWTSEPHAVRQASSSLSPATLCTGCMSIMRALAIGRALLPGCEAAWSRDRIAATTLRIVGVPQIVTAQRAVAQHAQHGSAAELM